LKPGSIIKHYKLTELLGESKTGVVYKAQDMHLLRPVAIKFLYPDHPDNKLVGEILENKALGIETINHPALCTLYEIDQIEGQPFVVTEYLQGLTLQQALDSEKLTSENIRKIVATLLDVFQVIHKAGQSFSINAHHIFLCKDLSIKVAYLNFCPRMHRDLQTLGKRDKNECENDSNTRLDTEQEPLENHTSSAHSTEFQRDIKSLGQLFYEIFSSDQINSASVPAGVEAQNLIRLHRSRDRAKWKRILDKMLSSNSKQAHPSIKAIKADMDKGSTLYLMDKRFLTVIVFCLALLLATSVYTALHLYHAKQEKLYYHQRYEISTHSVQALNWFEKGQQAWWRYDLKRAIDCFEIATNIDSTFVYAHMLNGVILGWEDYHKRSSKSFDRVRQYCEHASEWEKYLAKGFVGYHERDPPRAHTAFKTCINHCPDLIDAHLGEALVFEMEKKYEKAISCTKKVISIDSLHISAHSNIADLYVKMARYKKAEQWAQQAVRLIRTSGDTTGIENVYDLLGNIYRLNTKYPQAIAFYKKALNIAPLQRTNWGLLAETLTLNGQIRKAEKALEEALSLPFNAMDKAELYRKLGYIYLFSGQYDSAIEAFQSGRDISFHSFRFQQYLSFSQFLADAYFILRDVRAVSGTLHVIDRLGEEQFKELKNEIEYLKLYIQIRHALLTQDTSTLSAYVSDQLNQPLSPEFEISLFSEALMSLGMEKRATEWFQAHDTNAASLLGDEKLVFDYYFTLFLYRTGYVEEALARCNQIQENLTAFYKTDFNYIKVIVLFVDIYLALENARMTEFYVQKFFEYWRFADKDIPLYQEMLQKRLLIHALKN
jgi:tetratricopeptide (TPR) repeat protein